MPTYTALRLTLYHRPSCASTAITYVRPRWGFVAAVLRALLISGVRPTGSTYSAGPLTCREMVLSVRAIVPYVLGPLSVGCRRAPDRLKLLWSAPGILDGSANFGP